MRRVKRYLVPILMVLSLGFLMGDDCEFEFEGFPGVHVIGYDPYYYDYYDYVVIEEPVYYDPWFW